MSDDCPICGFGLYDNENIVSHLSCTIEAVDGAAEAFEMWRTRAQNAEAELAQRFVLLDTGSTDRVNNAIARAEWAEAELAAVQARRCEACHWVGESDSRNWKHCKKSGNWEPPDYACNYWEIPRAG